MENISKPRLQLICDEIETLIAVHDVHSKHEDDIIFPALERYFPGISDAIGEDHVQQHHDIDSLKEKVQIVKEYVNNEDGDTPPSPEVITAITIVMSQTPRVLEGLLDHLRHEEFCVTLLVRKHLTVKEQTDITRKCWDVTTYAELVTYFPWVSDGDGVNIYMRMGWRWREMVTCIRMVVFGHIYMVMGLGGGNRDLAS